jgi:hypothetical protein
MWQVVTLLIQIVSSSYPLHNLTIQLNQIYLFIYVRSIYSYFYERPYDIQPVLALNNCASSSVCESYVKLKNAVFWDVVPCISCVNRRFGGTYRLHLQGRKICECGTSLCRWLQTAGLGQLKKSTSSGLEPTTFRLVPQPTTLPRTPLYVFTVSKIRISSVS